VETILKKYLADYAILFSIAGIVVLLDQLTKQLVRANLPLGVVFMPGLWLSRYARVVHLKNSGATLGIFQNMNAVFMVLPIVIALAIAFYFPQIPRRDWLLRLALSLILGGGLGNLIDRLVVGYVTDFISIGSLPVMNLADASIWIGAALIFLWVWVQGRGEQSASDLVSGEGAVDLQESASRSFSEEQ